MFKRIYSYLRNLIFGTLDKLESPEIILEGAVREMKENQAKNRQRAVQAITQRNALANMVEKQEKLCRELEAKAATCVQSGNRELARTLLREKMTNDQTLENLKASLKQAEEISEAVKVAIRREDEQIRVKTAEALRLKAKMKQSQIQIEMNKALDGLTWEDPSQSFERAEERINNMGAEAAARSEISKNSVASRMASVDDMMMDAEADKALAELEMKLGLSAAPAAATVTSSPAATPAAAMQAAQESDIDRQLRELEQKLQQGN